MYTASQYKALIIGWNVGQGSGDGGLHLPNFNAQQQQPNEPQAPSQGSIGPFNFLQQAPSSPPPEAVCTDVSGSPAQTCASSEPVHQYGLSLFETDQCCAPYGHTACM
jgi:hypothetical protein